MKTLVVSAVNLRKGGTLKILRQCLEHLSGRISAGSEELRVVALVHKRALCDYPGIDYIEIPWAVKSWGHRLWCEYVTMHRISREIAAADGHRVWTWLSLHDTTPRVEAEHREVYCHTSFPFLKLKFHDLLMDPKIPMFSLLGSLIYRINVHRNDSIIVQQNWFADAMSRRLGVSRDRFRVIPPVPVTDNESSCSRKEAVSEGGYCSEAAISAKPEFSGCKEHVSSEQASAAVVPAKPGFSCREAAAQSGKGPSGATLPTFLYAATPDCHKNFETLLEAARRLESELGPGRFRVIITIRGDENRYSRWLHKRWGSVQSIDFHGFMKKEELFANYASALCYVCPSRVETWCLPVSEYMDVHSGGAMLLADLPYAHETAAAGPIESVEAAVFFKACDAGDLKTKMAGVLAGAGEAHIEDK